MFCRNKGACTGVRVITVPLWFRIENKSMHILDMNTSYHELVTYLNAAALTFFLNWHQNDVSSRCQLTITHRSKMKVFVTTVDIKLTSTVGIKMRLHIDIYLTIQPDVAKPEVYI